MGKKKGKDVISEEDTTDSSNSPHKKHKKHKHKKHKKLKEDSDDLEVDMVAVEKPLKLKIKLGGKSNESNSKPNAATGTSNSAGDEDEKKKMKRSISDAEEEEAWLEALEMGKLDEFDEIKKMKDPALMTARQRALLEGKNQKFTYFPEPENKQKEMTEEMRQRKAMNASKRKQQVQAKREKDKKQTLDRLLKKQDSKVKGDKARASKKGSMSNVSYCYINNSDCIQVCVPLGFPFPMTSAKALSAYPTKEKCCIIGCTNDKKYNCSKTLSPVCSLECYKKNLIQQPCLKT